MAQKFAGLSAQPVLPVKSVESSVAFYTGIGFGGVWLYGDPASVGGLALDAAQIQFERSEVAITPQKIWIRSDGVDHIHELAADFGAKILREPSVAAHGFLEFSIEDPDGHILTFAQALRRGSQAKEELEGVKIEYRKLTPEEHQTLSDAVGWGQFIHRPNVPDQISRLEVTAVAIYNDSLIGAASLAGDGRFIHIVGDVMVLPQFQSQGIGKKLIRALDHWLAENAAPNAFVCLFTGAHQADYYRQFGFVGPESGFVGMSKVMTAKSTD